MRLVAQAVLLAFLAACVSDVTLQSGLSDADANEVVTLLKRNGVAVNKVQAKGGVTLTVREGQLARAADLMQAAGLPRKAQAHLGQVFKKEGMISTPMEERARYLYALSQELEYTLSQIDGVIVARVHVVLPERVAPGEPVQPSSAAVFLKVQAPFDEDLLVPRVKRLITTSIPGLTDEVGARKLSVVLVPTQKVDAPHMDWQQVGPFLVEMSSAEGLRTVALAVSVIIAVLLALVLYFGGHYVIVMMARRKLKQMEEKRLMEAANKSSVKAMSGTGVDAPRSTDSRMSVA
jgi:type III secretion protein J